MPSSLQLVLAQAVNSVRAAESSSGSALLSELQSIRKARDSSLEQAVAEGSCSSAASLLRRVAQRAPPAAGASNPTRRRNVGSWHSSRPHVTALYPFKDGISTMEDILIDAFQEKGPPQSTAGAAQAAVAAALAELAKAEQASRGGHRQRGQQESKASSPRPASCDRSPTQASSVDTAPRPSPSRLPRPSRLCYSRPIAPPLPPRSRQRDAAKPASGSDTASALPRRRLPCGALSPPRQRPQRQPWRPRSGPHRRPATGALPVMPMFPQRSGRREGNRPGSESSSSGQALMRHAEREFGWAPRQRRGVAAGQPSAHPAQSPPTPEAAGDIPSPTAAAVADMYATVARRTARAAKANRQRAEASVLEQEEAERRAAAKRAAAFKAASRGDDEAAAVFLGLPTAPDKPGARSTAASGGGRQSADGPVRQPPVAWSVRSAQEPADPAAETLTAAQELLALAQSVTRASALASPSGAAASRLAAAAAVRSPPTRAGPAPTPFASDMAHAQDGSGDIVGLMSPAQAARDQLQRLGHAPPRRQIGRAAEAPHRHRPPTFTETALTKDGSGPRYLRGVQSRIKHLVRAAKAQAQPNHSAPLPQPASPPLPPSQAGAALYDAIQGRNCPPSAHVAPKAAVDTPNAALPALQAPAPGLPGVAAETPPSTAALAAQRTARADAVAAAAEQDAQRRREELEAAGVRLSPAAVSWTVAVGDEVGSPEVPVPPDAQRALHTMRKRQATAAQQPPSPKFTLKTKSGDVEVGAQHLEQAVSEPQQPALPQWYADAVAELQSLGVQPRVPDGMTIPEPSVQAHSAFPTQQPAQQPTAALSVGPRPSTAPGTSQGPTVAIRFDDRGVVTGQSALAVARAFLDGAVFQALMAPSPDVPAAAGAPSTSQHGATGAEEASFVTDQPLSVGGAGAPRSRLSIGLVDGAVVGDTARTLYISPESAAPHPDGGTPPSPASIEPSQARELDTTADTASRAPTAWTGHTPTGSSDGDDSSASDLTFPEASLAGVQQRLDALAATAAPS